MIGEVLANRYHILSLLGKKNGRKTFLVRDLHTLELAVIKLLSFDNDFQWDDLKLFEREARTLQNLSHTSIPSYIDYFEVETLSGFALVQIYIPAPTLEESIKSGRTFTESEVKQIATKLLDILIYLHSKIPPVIHRDIKPSNVLLGNRSGNYVGEVHLIDFGSVQNAAVREFGTRTVVGTYGYMALEQFGDRAVPASDIYSLGATLIYLVTGIHPADLPQKDGRIEFEHFTSLSHEFTNWLKAITEPTLEKRLSSATQALTALQQPKLNPNYFLNSFSKRGDWSWDGQNWIPKNQELLVNSLQNKSNPNGINLNQPSGSRITLHKSEDNLEILIPPIGFHPSLIFLGLFTTAWNSLTLLWTVGAVNSGVFPINLLFAILSLPFWGSGLLLTYSFIFSLWGKIRLSINKERIAKFYEIFGFKYQRPAASHKRDIHKLTYIPKHFVKDANGEKTQVLAQLIISTGVRKYKLQDGGAIANESELKWLAAELSDWLNLPVNLD
ncbi:serine/threonine-protein kinase [Rivularia sp. UHCC 0363]|uniref:serine/threonine protein kinase n=1 Tax=Rivularia sp. UHCC 0363 TaxID=3110244 RepID=UPI002B220B07|nr:serine/threonine-protein kinase [Rivularia sp. UHCC 0363]MEA5593603.1 serine/threonine-protein kinase [Rivularia sp. UHCC 0363]